MSVKVVTPNASSPQDLRDLLRQGMSDNDIEFLLQQHYQDDFLVKNLMTEVKKLRNARKTTSGLMFVLAGAVLLLLGFFFSIVIGTSSTLFGVFLYGFTCAGIAVAFVGMIKMFG